MSNSHVLSGSVYVLCTSGMYCYTPRVYVESASMCAHLLILVIKPWPPCSSTQKRKSESYIFYKLSAVKEGAKNQNHKYCT